MRYSDRPIVKPSQDLLRRTSFALRLARAIDELSVAREGFVMALTGEWGSGKSSVIELIRRYLRHIEMARVSQLPLPSYPQADPRSITQLEEMAQPFEKIETNLVNVEAQGKDAPRWEINSCRSAFKEWLDTDDEVNLADYYWRLRLHANSNPRTIVLQFSPWLIAGRAELAFALLSELSRVLSQHLGEDVRHAFGDLLARLSEFAPIAGAGLDVVGVGGGLIRAWGDLSEKFAARMTTGPTLEEVRNRLKSALFELQDIRILIIVDDLDRLTPNEALEMVALVKSLGDLPNVIYLLSYDNKSLCKLINRATNLDGHEYLQKIVQYEVSLPEIESDDLARMLSSDLNKLLINLDDEDNRRLSRAWLFVLRFYLRTPRDIRRFANAVAVANAALHDYVDQVDLVLLETLRLFDPVVYQFVRDNLESLSD